MCLKKFHLFWNKLDKVRLQLQVVPYFFNTYSQIQVTLQVSSYFDLNFHQAIFDFFALKDLAGDMKPV